VRLFKKQTRCVLCVALCLRGFVTAAPELLAQQTSPQPAFEVASIKSSDSLTRGGGSGWEPGGRFRAVNVPGTILVQLAYGTPTRTLLGYQVDGVPGWLASARYDITGKIRTDLATTDLDELAGKGPLFLRSLLEERFRLKIHHETRQLPRYRLLRVRNDGNVGPRLRRFTCATAPKDMCKFEYLADRMIFDGVTMARLVDELAGKVDRVVADDTKLTGTFYMDLEWSPDGSASDKPSIFTALQEELGLKLEPERGAVDVVVIDHIERPTQD
jgi:uncharacterized protein (TIGR03435 family)